MYLGIFGNLEKIEFFDLIKFVGLMVYILVLIVYFLCVYFIF